MTREEAKKEIEKVFEPAFANYIIKALTDGATESDVEPQGDLISREAVLNLYEEYRPRLATNVCEFGDAVNQIPPAEQTEWISVKDRLPVCEEKVLVQAIRTFKDGSTITVITTGMYEDGTISECDSRWWWEDVAYEEWDDDNDCMIIPKGWWEDKTYNPDGAINYQIDDKVVAWMPLPSPYKGE